MSILCEQWTSVWKITIVNALSMRDDPSSTTSAQAN